MACNAFYNLYQLHSVLNKPFIFTLSSFIKPEKIIYSIVVVKMTFDSENPISNQKTKDGGKPLGTIWEDINQGQSVALGKFSASCKYYEEAWNREEVSKLEEHLSNHCKGAPANVIRKYMTRVLERQDNSTKRRKLSSGGQQNIYDYHD